MKGAISTLADAVSDEVDQLKMHISAEIDQKTGSF
jgi:hypothetical protein